MLAGLKKALNLLPLTWLRPQKGQGKEDVQRFLFQEKVRGYLSAIGNQARFFPLIDNYTEETAEIRLAYRVMLRDPYVKAALFTKVLAVASLDPQVQPASERPEDEQAADFVKYNLAHVQGGLKRLTYNVLVHGLIDGYSVSEKTYKVAERGKYRGKIVLKSLRAKDSRHLVLQGDSYRNVTAVRDLRAGQLYHPSNFCIWSNLPLFDNPVGMSDLRAAYRAFWLVDTAWRLRAIGMERFGLPIVKGTYQDPNMQGVLEDKIALLRSQSWITLPEQVKVEALDLASRSQSDFESAIRDLREEIVLGITGAVLQMLQGSVSDGRGSSLVHRSTAELLQWWIAAEVGDVISNQIVPDLVEWNFAGADYPVVTLGGVSDATLAETLRVDQGLQQMGLALSKEELYKKYGRQKPTTPEDELKPQGQQQQPPGGPGGFGGDPGAGDSPVSLPFAEGRPRARRRRKKKFAAKAGEDDGEAKPHRFSSTQFNLGGLHRHTVRKLAAAIPDEDLAADGREAEPHVTVKYGLHADDAEPVRRVVGGFGPVKVRLGKVTLFPANEATAQRGGEQYDVVKVDVDGEDIRRLNKLISDSLPHTDTHPEYKPHVTLAYVKAGEGHKYAGADLSRLPPITLRRLVFSSKDRAKTVIPLGGVKAFADGDEEGPAARLVAGTHADYAAAEALLKDAQDRGGRVLRKLCAAAVKRSFAEGKPPRRLFTDDEREQFAAAIGRTVATAHLLGRYRTRTLAEKAAKDVDKFSDQAVLSFAEPPPPLPPLRALAWFLERSPKLAVTAKAFADAVRRESFRLAKLSEQTLLEKVHGIVAKTLATGDVAKADPVGQVRAVLDEAGVSPKNPAMAENIFRTNIMQSFVEGSQQEMRADDVKDLFPAWEFLGIADGRQRPSHAKHNGKFFANHVTFAEVRDSEKGSFDGFSCRCVPRPVSRREVQRRGIQPLSRP